MSGMAEVLAAHSSWTYELDYDDMGTNGIWCDMCGEGEDFPGDPEDEWIAKHQAAMLTAAGFGPVKEAWDEGYTTGNAHNGRRDANPYRATAVRGEG